MTTGADSSTGDGLMVTDKILEFRTVLFLQRPQKQQHQRITSCLQLNANTSRGVMEKMQEKSVYS